MTNRWHYSTTHNSPCKVLQEQELWGQKICHIVLIDSDKIYKVPCDTIEPLESVRDAQKEVHRIFYIASAAKIAQAIEHTVSDPDNHRLLSPIESNVIPLPHQVSALKKAIAKEQVRYLIADEVGLGKTIEAGLILKELKLRGLVRRVLVIAPKSIALQWISEMQTHFNEQFQLILGEDVDTLKRIASARGSRSPNPWSVFDQVVVTMDAVKPIDKRRGWSEERIKAYNADRYEDLIAAGWDLVIVDEAHRLGGSSEQVARYKLGKGLSEAVPYILLLSATPHQGKSDAFYRLMRMLDRRSFIDETEVTKERVAEYTIRTEKRKAIDANGVPLFKPRITQMLPVQWQEKHCLQRELYEAVTEYVREGYNRAIEEKKRHIGFLMVLMQRLVASSTRAIRTTLQRRVDVLISDQVEREGPVVTLDDSEEAYYDTDAQELLDALLASHMEAVQDEVFEVESLLELASRAEAAGIDAKAEALIEKIYQLQRQESDPELKVLVFTEFVPTQQMLSELLQSRGISVVTLNGSMSMQERESAQKVFADDARVLISTDAGGEGLNLQFCHIVINYDLPWNPMRLEQRIGRIDRIGQMHTVKAINFVFEESVEYRVREVLEEKLQLIYEEFGIDKTGDVLDSAQAGEIFEEIFASAILDPDTIDETIKTHLDALEQEIGTVRKEAKVYTVSDEHTPEDVKYLQSHPLPYWVERMVTSYLEAKGGEAVKKRYWWDLHWPDGIANKRVVFNIQDAMHYKNTTLLNLESEKVQALVAQIPSISEIEPIPAVIVENLPKNISGYWGLYEIALQANLTSSQYSRISSKKRDFIALFISEEGRVFLPTARHIWDFLQRDSIKCVDSVIGDSASFVYRDMLHRAKETGLESYNRLVAYHMNSINQEESRAKYAFERREKAIGKIGLEEVREHRLKMLRMEREEWEKEMMLLRQSIPNIRTLLLMKIIPGKTDA